MTLSFDTNELSGLFPSEIGLLRNLKTLTLSYYVIKGNIPTEIGMLRNLETLVLSNNWIEGSIPTELGALSPLCECLPSIDVTLLLCFYCD